MTERALEGVKVLDLTQRVAGPYCTKLLADFGADVVKVERPGGDPGRRIPPFVHDDAGTEMSLPFLYLNTSKRGVTLNLKTRRGRQMLMELARDADILVESFSPRVMPSLGLGFKALNQANPSLVMVSISNFGQTGPYRDYKATEIVEYALGGLMYIFGAHDREPLKHALRQAQFKAGTDAASAALMALYHQRLTGAGQHVDVSIQECVASSLRDVVSSYTYTGAVRRRQPSHRGDLNRVRQVSDGYILPNPGATASSNWKNVVDLLGAPELDDEKFTTPSARMVNAEELGELLDRHFLPLKKFDLFYEANRRRFTYGVVQSPEEVMASEQSRARGYFVELHHPAAGAITYPGAPFIMEGTPWEARLPAPTLGQHNHEVFGDRLGYSGADMARLRAMEVV